MYSVKTAGMPSEMVRGQQLDANSYRDAILINATINCLGPLVRTRVSTADRIFNAALRFNPFKRAELPLTPKAQIIIRSMDRTMRAFFMSLGRKSVSPMKNVRE